MNGDRAAGTVSGGDGAATPTGASRMTPTGSDPIGEGRSTARGAASVGSSPLPGGGTPGGGLGGGDLGAGAGGWSAWRGRLARIGYRPPEQRSLWERLVPAFPDGPGVPVREQSALLLRRGIVLPPGLWAWLCRWSGWLGPLAVTLFGGLLIFTHLTTPHAIIFDETYYAKDSWALWHYGFEVNWPDSTNAAILATPQHLPAPTGAAFIAHPPAGKWAIGLGEKLFGLTHLGWRFTTATAGTLAILITARIGRRLLRSTLLGCTAALLMCADGLHMVMSRTGLLDQLVMFWALVSFALLLVDRDHTRTKLAHALGAGPQNPNPVPDHDIATRTRFGWRPLRWTAGITLGLCCATKWNGLDFLAAYGILTVLWDAGARKTAGARHPYLTTLIHDTPLALLALPATALATYLASWTGWLTSNTRVGTTNGGYDRHWADHRQGLSAASWGPLHHLPQIPMTWVPAPLRSLWHYHSEIWYFNTHLTTPHTYMSNPYSWLLQTRPVSFYYPNDLKPSQCGGASQCSSEVLALGTPLLWWTATAALLYALYRTLTHRDWRTAALCCATAAGYLPWFWWQQRTIFNFYSIDYEPYLCLLVALLIGVLLGPATATPRRRLVGTVTATVITLAVLTNFLYFLPLYDAQIIPYTDWQKRMWWPTWI